MLITKSDYLLFLCCKNEFWLKKRKPEFKVATEMSLDNQHRIEQGKEVEQLAYNISRLRKADVKQVHIEKNIWADNLYCRCDILVELYNGKYELYEVKSGASIKEENYDDVTFQRIVLSNANYVVSNVFLVYVNTDYVLGEELDVDTYFIIEDVTAIAKERTPQTKLNIASAINYLNTEPVFKLIDLCSERLNCAFALFSGVTEPAYSVFNIARLHTNKLYELLQMGIVDIMDIPQNFKLSSKQQQQINIAQNNTTYIDKEAINDTLNNLVYPLYFYDYETFNATIPMYKGLKPYQQMVFQFSLHIKETPFSELKHHEFLSKGHIEPSFEVAQALSALITKRQGTFIVWNQSFEKTRNKEIANMYPQFTNFLNWVNEQTFDLMKIFSQNYYMHPEFKGSCSIKKVLPVLVPELSYQNLAINEGMTASIKWFQMASNKTNNNEKEAIYQHLLAYCKLDTLAMVKILEKIQKLAK